MILIPQVQLPSLMSICASEVDQRYEMYDLCSPNIPTIRNTWKNQVMKNSLGLKMGPNFITADTFLLSFDIGTFFNPRVESRGATVPAKPKLYESPINRIVQKKKLTLAKTVIIFHLTIIGHRFRFQCKNSKYMMVVLHI